MSMPTTKTTEDEDEFDLAAEFDEDDYDFGDDDDDDFGDEDEDDEAGS